MTVYLPEGDKYSINRTGIESRLATLYGGRVAEELIFGADKVTTGASNDIERATKMARNMAVSYTHLDVYKRQATRCRLAPFR